MSDHGKPVQIAYAVQDLEAAARRWAARAGAGPFFVLEHIPLVTARYRGTPADFDHSSAYGQWGRVMVELVKDHTVGPSPVRDVVGEGGTGLHHVAYFVEDLGQESKRLEGLGWPEALYAETATGQAFAFHDATEELGHMIELYEPSDRLRSFYAMVAASARDWEGSDPVRFIGR